MVILNFFTYQNPYVPVGFLAALHKISIALRPIINYRDQHNTISHIFALCNYLWWFPQFKDIHVYFFTRIMETPTFFLLSLGSPHYLVPLLVHNKDGYTFTWKCSYSLYLRFNGVESGIQVSHFVHPSGCGQNPCPLFIYHNINSTHFILTHLFNQLQKVGRAFRLFNSKIISFAEYFYFMN